MVCKQLIHLSPQNWSFGVMELTNQTHRYITQFNKYHLKLIQIRMQNKCLKLI
ncbi:hypothetical protein M595_0620 [Lyngbya aestuarii BL J]|uniref:Uncharacterized protein n=1 Tax=Lyngbya aestuarii BL J TaxID=1348334 RepID=U7QQJ2_9CYAN|nr:hypothetical protein M595_0620 [Lyngbya aestuarii BL J]